MVFQPASGRYLVVWEDSAGGNWDVNGRPVLPDGTLDGSSYPVAAGSQDERYPRIAADPTGGGMVVWQGYEGSDGSYDLHGRQLWADGKPVGASFALVENDEDQQRPCIVGDEKGGYLLTWQDDRNGNWDVYGALIQAERVIEYSYDGLYRLAAAHYDNGVTFEYVYDVVGNRTWMTHTTPLIGRVVTRYTYDAANQLTHVNGIALTWDNNGNLLQDQAGYMYTYDAANRLVKVVQLSNVYSYAYNGTGDRLQQTVNGVVVTYTLDLYGGLAQVLMDGSNAYLYGLGRIGEEQPAGRAYHLADGLGSVRQVADAAGDVTLAQSFKPYGGVLESAGDGATAYAFTGEWTDETGLVHLRARDYAPASGRFLTRDPWGGDRQRPLTLNGFAYVEANPVNRTDPTGQHWDPFGAAGTPNPRDLTDWLYREIVTNANHPAVRRLRAWNAIAYGWEGVGLIACGVGVMAGQPVIIAGGGVVIVGGAVFHTTALYEYSQLVKNGALWDVKDEIGIQLGPGITLCSFGTCYKDIEYSVPGNIHFAYIGVAAGFFGWEIQAGAAWAEIHDPAHDPESREYVGPYVGPDGFGEVFGPTWWDPSSLNFGDEPVDHEAVTLGIKLWQKYEGRMTRSDFETELGSYIGRLARCAPDSEPVEEDVARNWPYPVGYFNNRSVPYKPPSGRCP